tara:strand:+ start:1023 stop:2180 length:1158 start_codon:yes stop_codon:yes gene_type:complete
MERDVSVKMGRPFAGSRMMIAAVSVALSGGVFGVGSTFAEEDATSAVLKDGKIGYAMTMRHWAIYQTPEGKTECPQGFNDGPREQFKLLFPDDGTKRTLMETQISRESEVWHPGLSEEPYPFLEVVGKTSRGLDLDGQVDSNDFVSPEGDEGIDNQLYRAIGCIANFRGPDGTAYHFENNYMQRYNYNRLLIELTGVDNLVNDDDVTVTTYRGLDGLLTDATGKDFIPGGTQRVDMRWGKEFIQEFKGKIVDGVLTTEAKDLQIPWSVTFDTNTIMYLKDVRFDLKLTPDGGEGLIGAYADIHDWYYHATVGWSTHHQSYGQESSPSMYRALNRLADAYPDPETGKNTAISTALDVKFTQVFILHPAQEVAEKEDESSTRIASAK